MISVAAHLVSEVIKMCNLFCYVVIYFYLDPY
jgi:hypothetical protein